LKKQQKFIDFFQFCGGGEQRFLSKKTVLPLSAMPESLISTLYLIFLKNNLKFDVQKPCLSSLLCIFAKELRI